METIKKTDTEIQQEWYNIGETYASEVNKMVAFGEEHGWDNWKGNEPEDNRDHLADTIIQKLREANKSEQVEKFREQCPPAHTPLIKYFKEKGQNIEQLCFIKNEKIVFVTGSAYQKRQAYLLDNRTLIKLDGTIEAIGKSHQNNIFAIKTPKTLITRKEWDGTIIETFELGELHKIGITNMTPFNDGKKVLVTTSEGIYIVSKNSINMVHPEPDLEDEEWEPYLDMENATLSNDNKYIVVGDQSFDHRVLDNEGNQIGEIGPQSSYPHFCLFSKDDKQLITNSCHFYNGITIGVDAKNLNGLEVESYVDEADNFKVIDDEMRVYVGTTTKDYYILGDAYGYIKAFDKNGNCIWRHYLGSTISGITISDNEQTLWVSTYAGILHKLKLGKGHRDTHTIGNGNHYEDFRLIIWKDEEKELWW
ncbi:hypothetical protein C7448_103259 [Tenacibaculum gallaicum]|uniref:Uncharacterized protein n=1 Tax=Tenacibaculum gallaicum TaxID=561505 RepID=A0A3E0I1A2_9FLAO|nr:hypothetical protein [Tenacibaculum gallaicum]REH52524.1 hypothetical protein C7448_103259 [Tenacibaculum gallaicum]